MNLMEMYIKKFGISKDTAKRIAILESIAIKRDRAIRHRIMREIEEWRNEQKSKETEVQKDRTEI